LEKSGRNESKLEILIDPLKNLYPGEIAQYGIILIRPLDYGNPFLQMKNKFFLFYFITMGLVFLKNEARSQPYIDLASMRYVSSPAEASEKKGQMASPLNYFNFSFTVPIQFNNKKSTLILSPFFERWQTSMDSVHVYHSFHYGLVLPVSLLMSIGHSNWNLLATAIVRMNDVVINRYGECQFGGYAITSYKKSATLTYKMGVYINGDYFGLFVMPLLGIDWQINDRDNLFGVLPASLTFEHKLNKHFYTGTVFRTFTNSYHDSGNNYIRIDENQLGLFFDTYVSKKILLNIEAGHSVLRKIRTGPHNEINYFWNDQKNFYFKFMIAYRFRLR
jgi:hypothetical protein